MVGYQDEKIDYSDQKNLKDEDDTCVCGGGTLTKSNQLFKVLQDLPAHQCSTHIPYTHVHAPWISEFNMHTDHDVTGHGHTQACITGKDSTNTTSVMSHVEQVRSMHQEAKLTER